MSKGPFTVLLFTFLFAALHSAALPVLPHPDPAVVQIQTILPASRSPPATIPAFPEQSDVAVCPLDLPEDLFRGVKSACVSSSHHRPDPKSYSGQLHRTRCCPVLAAWLYSAYSKTALSAKAKPQQQTETYEMPLLPDDSEACVDTLEKALANRGIELGQPNETCDVVYCYCDIRLHPFSCPESFSMNAHGKLVGGESVKKLERDCVDGGCSKCLGSLRLLNGDKATNTSKPERKSKIHDRDCELMGITWLLHKDRVTYIRTVSAVLRALMMSTDKAPDYTYCTLNSDGMPLAVDSAEINGQSSSAHLQVEVHPHHFLVWVVYSGILFLITRY